MKPQAHRIPLTAVGIIAASVLVAVILAVTTVRNLRREQNLMESFLLRESFTLIRTLEAGARAADACGGGQQRGLEAVVKEAGRGQAIAYLRVVAQDGQVLADASPEIGNVPPDLPMAARVIAGGRMETRLVQAAGGKKVFEVAKEFDAPGARGRRDSPPSCWEGWNGCSPPPAQTGGVAATAGSGASGSTRKAVYLGLYTKEFDDARAEDVRRSLLIAGALVLCGAAGFYFLFLSQSVRVARATIETMTLYNRDVIESLPDGLVTLDSQGRLVSLNRKAEELLGASAPQALGRCLKEISGRERCDLEPLVRGGGEFRDFPMECLAADGKSIPVKVSGSRLTSREGEKLGTVLLLRDLREIRAMEEQLERSRRLAALGRMAAGIAHEIRNPLGTLRGFAQYLGGSGREDATASEYATLMVGEVDRLNRIVEALLQFARPREPEFREVLPSALLSKAQKLLQGDFDAAELTLSLEPPQRDIPFQADPDLLIQVLLNLLHNAVAATPRGGEVVLGARFDGDRVRLWVGDTGTGLRPEERQRMFDPFFTTRRTGTGLGLAVVHQIVEQHGGTVDVGSEEGKGTTVTLSLPVARG